MLIIALLGGGAMLSASAKDKAVLIGGVTLVGVGLALLDSWLSAPSTAAPSGAVTIGFVPVVIREPARPRFILSGF